MYTRLIPISLLSLITCISCIKNEPLNPEADILVFEMPEEIVLSAATFSQNTIAVTIRKGADLSSITPKIEITEGATIVPDPSQPRDFNETVAYTVTSEDGAHQRVYTIELYSSTIYKYGFENWKSPRETYNFEHPFEYNDKGQEMTIWDSSNSGIVFYQRYPTASGYPIHATTEKVSGNYAAEIVTLVGPGTVLENVLYIPIAAGSLFTGTFNPLFALINPLMSTQFGQIFNEKPESLRGYYKYTPGTGDYIAPDGRVKPGVKDSCAIYSVFYRVDEDLESLDGTNVLDHPNIIALAMLPPEMRARSEGSDFVYFDIPFEYKSGAEVDFEKYNYKLSTVFSSSFYGNRYEGVIGSQLIVDEVEILAEKTKTDDEEE